MDGDSRDINRLSKDGYDRDVGYTTELVEGKLSLLAPTGEDYAPNDHCYD